MHCLLQDVVLLMDVVLFWSAATRRRFDLRVTIRVPTRILVFPTKMFESGDVSPHSKIYFHRIKQMFTGNYNAMTLCGPLLTY